MKTELRDCDTKHICPTCNIEFNTEKYNTAHCKAYYHMVKSHAMRINIGCHPKCLYIPICVLFSLV